jgi:hypothetical protein
MFDVNDRVNIISIYGLSGTVKETLFVEDSKFYMVDVDGYSDTIDAKKINSLIGLDHGYVPLLESDLELI